MSSDLGVHIPGPWSVGIPIVNDYLDSFEAVVVKADAMKIVTHV